jgi:hypothetical protein
LPQRELIVGIGQEFVQPVLGILQQVLKADAIDVLALSR